MRDKVLPPPGRRAVTSVLLVGALALLAGRPGSGAAQVVPPDADWRTVETEHFRVTFPAHLEELGRETAARAERAYVGLSDLFTEPPDGRTEILLTDHLDQSNGSARVSPFKRIVLFARPPIDGLALSYFDDWLEVVLIHELAHVFHLDVAGPVGSALRSVFGRVPVTWPFFPNQSTPRWTIEGLATWYESALSESGRTRGTQHEMTLRTAALEDRFEDIDQASGLSPVWPGGSRPYIYGSLFFDYLIERYGVERMEDFVEAVGGQIIPYRLNSAAENAFGVSFTQAWRTWRDSLTAGAFRLESELAARAPLTTFEPLTERARIALYPRATTDGAVVFVRSDGLSDAQLRWLAPDGRRSDGITRINSTGPFDIAPDGSIVFAQLRLDGPYRAYSDLHSVTREGDVRRITEAARLEHPSVTPDGRRAVALQAGGGSTRLVEVDLETGDVVRALTSDDPDEHWAFPAVSPDGRWIAAARWTSGAYFDIVVGDLEGGFLGGDVVEVTADRAVDTAPAWSPDGRWLVWTSDRSGIPNVLAVPVDPETGRIGGIRQVTNVVTGVHFPSISPDGRWLYLSRYNAEGWDVERTAFDPASFFDPFAFDTRFRPTTGPIPTAAGIEVGQVADAPVRDYDPMRTVLPRFWEPAVVAARTGRDGTTVVGHSFGFLTQAQDLLGRHSLDLSVLTTTDWLVSGDIGYAYAGFGNPVLGLSASQSWSAIGPVATTVDDQPVSFFVRERERAALAAVTFRRARLRGNLDLSIAGGMVWERRELLDLDLSESSLTLTEPTSRLTDFRTTLTYSSARSHAFSVSDEEGVSLLLRGRTRHELDVDPEIAGEPRQERSFDEVIARLRAFTSFGGPGFADHVIALRGSLGVAGGPGADAFHFDIGGASGQSENVTGFSLIDGRSFFFPARGFSSGTRGGHRAWSASLEYRFPLALVNEGIGLFPLHVDRVQGSLFVDAANAWGPDLGGDNLRFANPRRDPLVSTGAEVITDLLTLFSESLTVRSGLAVPLLGEGGVSVYVRFGRAF